MAITDERATLTIDSFAIGERLKEARKFLGLSQQALADRIDASKTGIQANEAGKSVPGGSVLACFIDLGISADWILSKVGAMQLPDANQTRYQPPEDVDLKLVGECVELLEVALNKFNRTLTPEKKRAAIEAMYRAQKGKAEIDHSLVDMIVKLAA